jgi:hypothetical protein
MGETACPILVRVSGWIDRCNTFIRSEWWLGKQINRLWRVAPRAERKSITVHGFENRAEGCPAASRSRYAHRAPLHSPQANYHMGNFNLIYGISKRTPASGKVLKEILEVQAAVNDACAWSHERLALVAPREPGRATLTLPFTRFGFTSAPMTLQPDSLAAGPSGSSENAFVQGSTRVRDSLWNAHLVAAFLKHVSRMHPGLLFELRDEGGFVVTGSVWIRGGNVETNREFLNRERARALEVTGDLQAAVPYVHAELQGLTGNFFLDAMLSEHGAVPELRDLETRWQELEDMSLSDAAQLVVEHATKATAPVMA